MILIVDSFFTGSHKYWGTQLKKQLPFEVELLTLPGKFWKWRMEGGAIELAENFKKLKKKPSLIIATDMVNIPLFYANAGITKEEIPCVMYFHENQFAYPVSDLDSDVKMQRDNHYGFINLSSALFAEQLVFNSEFNRTSFLDGAKQLIKKLPDNSLSLESIKTQVIYPGVENDLIPSIKASKVSTPVLLWNHRWEHDKNPDLFIAGLKNLKEKSIDFKLIIIGKGTESSKVKDLFAQEFKNELIHCGFVESREEYNKLLSQATHLPVTSKHDFFGLSVAEAMSYGSYAILPNHQAYPEHLYNNEESGVLYEFHEGYFEALEKSFHHFHKGKTKKEFLIESIIEDWKEILLDAPEGRLYNSTQLRRPSRASNSIT